MVADFFGSNDAKAETPVLWPPHEKSWLIGKDSDAGRDLGQGEKGMTEDEMAGWHHRLDGHEFEWIPGVGDGQGGLACCDSWGRKESDTTEQLNWTELNELRASRGGNEGGNRQNRLHLESRTSSWAGLWTLSYMPSTYENDIPTGKPGPLDRRAPGLVPRLSIA